jgi:hypothetical protein
VLECFVLTWQFRVAALLDEAGLTGLPVVQLIFDSVAEQPAAQHVMNAIVLFFLKSKTPRTMEIPDHEYFLVDPDAWTRGVRPAGIDELFARAIGGPPDDPETAALVRHLIAGLYGVPLRMKIIGETDMKRAYREFAARSLD